MNFKLLLASAAAVLVTAAAALVAAPRAEAAGGRARFDFEQGEIGPYLFRAACNMGLEGLVSKHRDRPYRGGRSKDWIKVKDRSHPAIERVKNALS